MTKILIILFLIISKSTCQENQHNSWESIKLNPVDISAGVTAKVTGPATVFNTIELSKLVRKMELMKLTINSLKTQLELSKKEAELQRVSKINIQHFMELQTTELNKVIQVQRDLIDTVRKELESSGKRGKTRGLIRKLGQVLSTYGYYKALDDLVD